MDRSTTVTTPHSVGSLGELIGHAVTAFKINTSNALFYSNKEQKRLKDAIVPANTYHTSYYFIVFDRNADRSKGQLPLHGLKLEKREQQETR